MTTNINADDGVVSGVAGLKTSADNSGVLALQTNGTTGLTVNASQALGVGSTPSYGTSGQVLTSGGSSAAPTWTTVGGGSSQWTTSGLNIYYNTGNVGIGTSSPVGKLQLAQTNSTTINGGAYINLGKSENGVGGYHLIGMGYNTGSDYAPTYMGYVETNNASGTAGDLVFLTRPTSNASTTAPTERLRIPAAGGVQAVTTISVGNATPSTSGAGITFPATQSASSDANTLDDYEEGTWTPTAGGSLTVVGTFSSTGKYTKVGRLVTVSGTISATTLTLAANQQVITGLPFNNTADSAGGTITSGTNTGLLWMLTGGTTQIYSSSSNGPSSTFYFSLTYYAS